jgi:glycosyltransferase involved in cell wall biosynthesis
MAWYAGHEDWGVWGRGYCYHKKDQTMTNAMPNISVVMPVYNTSKYLAKAIESVLNQTFQDFELIIIDDCSTDESWLMISKYAKQNSRIRAVRNTDNMGIAYTRNRGLELAKADIVAIADSDDVNNLNRLDLQFEYLRKNPNVSIVGSYAQVINEKDVDIELIKFASTPTKLRKTFFYHYPFLQPTTMYRKRHVLAVGGYREKYSLVDEIDLYLRLFFCGYSGANIPQPLVHYRRHAESTLKNSAKKINVIFRLRKETLRNFKSYNLGYHTYTYASFILNKTISEKWKSMFFTWIKSRTTLWQ